MIGREHPVVPPRPMFETLPKAVRAAIRHGNSLSDINAARWSETYQCSEDDVQAEWTRALTSVPPNSCEGEGK